MRNNVPSKLKQQNAFSTSPVCKNKVCSSLDNGNRFFYVNRNRVLYWRGLKYYYPLKIFPFPPLFSQSLFLFDSSLSCTTVTLGSLQLKLLTYIAMSEH